MCSEEYAIASDLKTFMAKYAVEGNSAETFTCVSVNDGECPTSASEAGTEANLDVRKFIKTFFLASILQC